MKNIRRAMLPGASEHDEQAALIEWCRLNEGRFPQLRWLFAIPNGTYTTRTSAVKAINEGVKKGVADLFLPAPMYVVQNHGNEIIYIDYHGLFIEMKTAEGTVSQEQRQFIKDVRALGYAAEVCRGFDAARALIEAYLGGKYQPGK